jgi:hypothetical protein
LRKNRSIIAFFFRLLLLEQERNGDAVGDIKDGFKVLVSGRRISGLVVGEHATGSIFPRHLAFFF